MKIAFGKFLAVAVLKQFLEVRQYFSPSVMSIFSKVQLLMTCIINIFTALLFAFLCMNWNTLSQGLLIVGWFGVFWWLFLVCFGWLVGFILY